MPKRDVIVVGTSAGGLEALKSVLSQLPPNFPAAVFVVWHMPADQPSVLPQILNRHCSLPVSHAVDGEKIRPGQVYVAVPDHHLALEPVLKSGDAGQMRVTHGPKENLFRPSIDVLFRSAARAYGSRVVGVVLTGMLDDGASGLFAIKECGGLAVVQDPVEAPFPDMPINAMKAVHVDHVVEVAEMGELLMRLVNEDAQATAPQREHAVPKRMDAEVRIALEDGAMKNGSPQIGEPSLFACPECHGVLMQIKEGPLLRYRCHTGHAFSINALLSGITSSVEDALWNAIRAIQESEMLMSHMERQLREAGQPEAAELFAQRVLQARQRGEIVRQVVLSNPVISTDKIIDTTHLPDEHS